MPCSCGCAQQRFISPCARASSGGRGSSCGCGIHLVRITRLARPPLKPLGELRGLIYRASRAPGEAPKNYVHFFDQRLPVLAVDATGKRLYILGGKYRVTKRGIEG
jgi:hypothetical protein